jgi:hypothetical protein
MRFQYRPLPQGSKIIRVLELHPGRRKDEIKCSLQHCPFPPAETITYEPLSYCWGDARDKLPITVDGCIVSVTRNLHVALLRLRLENEKRHLWVDAICINQNDDVEKVEQVQIMRDIYQHGSQTLVWLGPDSFSITRGFSLISKLVKACKEFEEKHRHKISEHTGEVPYERYPSPRLSQFLAIFELPYFTGLGYTGSRRLVISRSFLWPELCFVG